jgi:hypothetical protein
MEHSYFVCLMYSKTAYKTFFFLCVYLLYVSIYSIECLQSHSYTVCPGLPSMSETTAFIDTDSQPRCTSVRCISAFVGRKHN